MEKIEKITDHENMMEAQKELEAMEDKPISAETPLSFTNFSLELQERFQRAVDYADLFVELRWYSCRRCGSVLSLPLHARRHPRILQHGES